MISGSGDKSIIEWDLDNSSSKKKYLLGHTGWINCIQMEDDTIVSGSSDHTIRSWSLGTGKPKMTYMGHVGSITCLQFNDLNIVSGGVDKTIRKFDPNKGTCLLSMLGHSSYISGLQFFGYCLATCALDKMIKMWDLRTGECHRTLKGHFEGVTCIQFDDMKLISGSYDKSFKVWDLRTGACISTISVGSVISTLKFDAKRIVVAPSDKTIKLFDPYIFTEQNSLTGHSGNITSLKFNEDFLMSGSTDCSLRMWHFKK